MPKVSRFAKKYAAGLAPLIGRELKPNDGLAVGFVAAAERKLKLKIPIALREYYSIAGRLALNKEHNQLYSPGKLRMLEGKLVFMEENQCVVFWGMDKEALGQDDSEVFQANNEIPIVWYSEELPFSDWIIKTWRWQAGLDAGH
ncbi:MAG TPA: hypothetical protein VFN26_15680 [Candidatus Acidoferrum sp.]|nr:hypothetical protein [Candidatus Acidoferrum sp.]